MNDIFLLTLYPLQGLKGILQKANDYLYLVKCFEKNLIIGSTYHKLKIKVGYKLHISTFLL